MRVHRCSFPLLFALLLQSAAACKNPGSADLEAVTTQDASSTPAAPAADLRTKLVGTWRETHERGEGTPTPPEKQSTLELKGDGTFEQTYPANNGRKDDGTWTVADVKGNQATLKMVLKAGKDTMAMDPRTVTLNADGTVEMVNATDAKLGWTFARVP